MARQRVPGPARRMVFVFVGFLAVIPMSGSALFTVPEPLTDGDLNYELSRNPRGCLALDSTRTLHAVYWWGEGGTSPDTPAGFCYRTWRPESGWTSCEAINGSFVVEGPEAGRYIGGRHPSLVVTSDDTVWIAWHDHRHCRSGEWRNWNDNTEIYADFRPRNGNFNVLDLRLTTSLEIDPPTMENPGHDNGFAPMLVAAPDGRLHAVWYDFHFGFYGDVFHKVSDTSGTWNLGETMEQMRLTRGGLPSQPPTYVVPDAAADDAGNLHVVWTSGISGAGDLYYGRVNGAGVLVEQALLREYAAGFFDPPAVVRAPNDDLWIVWSEFMGPNRWAVHVMRRASGAAGFDPSQRVTRIDASQHNASLAVDAFGLLHLVWIDERQGRHVYYGLYDPNRGELLEEQRLSYEAGQWKQASIAIDELGDLYVLLARKETGQSGTIYFTTTRTLEPASVPHWAVYE